MEISEMDVGKAPWTFPRKYGLIIYFTFPSIILTTDYLILRMENNSEKNHEYLTNHLI